MKGGVRKSGVILAILASLAGLCQAGWIDWLRPPPIVVVRGTESLKESGERAFAATLARQTTTWLNDLGLDFRLLDDDEVSRWSLRGARAVILPYNPDPSADEVRALGAVVRGGGILVVCYGQSDPLAALMGVRLAPYRAAGNGRRWTGFLLDTSAIPGLPASVRQDSSHLVPVAPAAGNAVVMGRWLGDEGTPTPEPAWVRSPAGFWMSHVLLPGDDENTQQLLLAMLATVLPDVWSQATRRLLDPERPFGPYARLGTARQELGCISAPPLNTGTPAAYLAARAMRGELTRLAASRQQFATAFTTRALWVDNRSVPLAADATAWATALDHHGINTVFAHAGNPVIPAEPLLPGGIPARLAIHAWLTCLNLEDAPPEPVQKLKTEHRLQVSDTGETLPWLCPSHPANRELLAQAATGLARSGLYAGVHLDYIRYRSVHSCYCEGCHQRFAQSLGKPVAHWPEDVLTGALAASYRQWRACQVTDLVAATSRAVRGFNPALKLSAAVYGATPACFTSVGQDWPAWLDHGLLDFACPMNYTADAAQLANLLKTQATLASADRIIPGIGISSSLSRLKADQAMAQLIQVKEAGFHGVALFELSPTVQADVLPCLQLQPGGAR